MSVHTSGPSSQLYNSQVGIVSSGHLDLSDTIMIKDGGLGITSYTKGDMVYYLGTDTTYISGDTMHVLPAGAEGQFLIMSSDLVPVWVTESDLQHKAYLNALEDCLVADDSMYLGSGEFITSDAEYNVAVGISALESITDGSANIAVGYNTLKNNTEGYANTAIGYRSMITNTTGSSNTAVGYESMENITTGVNNTAIGFQSLNNDDIGHQNTAVGYKCLAAGTNHSDNTAVGFECMSGCSQGNYNVAMGYFCLKENAAPRMNTAFGFRSMADGTSGDYNVAIGYESLNSNTGDYNTAVGYESMYGATGATGGNNTAVGMRSLYVNDEGNYNTAVGANSMATNTSGDYNTAMGVDSLYYSTGDSNTALGYKAGEAITTGTNNVIIGKDAAASKVDADNQIVIGEGALGHDDNIAVIGNTNCTAWHPADSGVDLGSSTYSFNSIYGDLVGNITGDLTGSMVCTGQISFSDVSNPTIKMESSDYTGDEADSHFRAFLVHQGTDDVDTLRLRINYGDDFSDGVQIQGTTYATVDSSSDDRLKHNEIDITNGLEIIRQLQPQKYDKTKIVLDADYNGNLSGYSNRKEAGVIAQDILEITDLKDFVTENKFITHNTSGTDVSVHTLDYNSIFTYNIAATKELDTIVQAQAEKITTLETHVTTLIDLVDALTARLSALE